MIHKTFEEIRKVLGTKIVGIAGLGGLGSNCAAALVRVGTGKLVLADFDIVEVSNLNRQFYFHSQIGMKKTDALQHNLRMIDPEVMLDIHDTFLVPDKIIEIYHHCDVIVEAFDKADQKQMIIETLLNYFPEKPLVCGLGMAGFGETNELRVEQHGNLFICGDMISEIQEDMPPLSPRVGIVSHMQANMVLEILLK